MTIEIKVNVILEPARVRKLFSSVGWVDEAKVPDKNLHQAFNVDAITASAWDQSELVGFVRGKIDGIYVFLVNLVVHPRYQHIGLGKNLFGGLATEAKSISGVFAVVGLGATGYENFYRGFGLQYIPSVIAISNKENL